MSNTLFSKQECTYCLSGWGGWSYLVEMPIVMESVQRNTPQQPTCQDLWRRSTPEDDLQCPLVSMDHRQAWLAQYCGDKLAT